MPVVDMTIDSSGAVAGIAQYEKAVSDAGKATDELQSKTNNSNSAFEKMKGVVTGVTTAFGKIREGANKFFEYIGPFLLKSIAGFVTFTATVVGLSLQLAKNTDEYKAMSAELEVTKNILFGIGEAFAVSIIPFITEAVEGFNDWILSGDNMKNALGLIVESIRFVHNGFSGLILLADLIAVAFSKMFKFIINGFTAMMKPASYFFKLLEKAGVIENNPFVKLEETLVSFSDKLEGNSTEALKKHWAQVEKNNQAYDEWKKKTGEVADQIKVETAALIDGTAAAEKLLPVMDELGNYYNKAGKETDRFGNLIAYSTGEVEDETAAIIENTTAVNEFNAIYGVDVPNNQAIATEAINETTAAAVAGAKAIKDINEESKSYGGRVAPGYTTSVYSPWKSYDNSNAENSSFGSNLNKGGLTALKGSGNTYNYFNQNVSRNDIQNITSNQERDSRR